MGGIAQKQESWVYRAQGDVDRFEAYFPGRAYAPHRHDSYTIGMTLAGVQCFNYRGTQRHSIPGGVVVLHPDELHDGQAGTDAGFRYRTICIDPALIQNALGGKVLPFIQNGLSQDKRLASVVRPLLEDYERPLESLEYQDALYDLAHVLDGLSGTGGEVCIVNYKATEQARQYIDEHLEYGVSLGDLERVSRHDRWKLSRDFRALFGVSPYRYLIMRRLDKARMFMRQGLALADVAVECGFSDQSHFNRHFKKTYGLTPRQWMKMQRASM